MPNLFESAERLYKRWSGVQTSSKSNATVNSNGNALSVNGRKASESTKFGRSGTANVSPLRWSEQQNYSVRAISSSNLTYSDDQHDSSELDKEINSNENMSPRAHPPGDLTAVSSSDDNDDDDSSYENLDLERSNNKDLDMDGFEPNEAYRRSQRLRRSLQKANANRPADFVDRIAVPSMKTSGTLSHHASGDLYQAYSSDSSDSEINERKKERSSSNKIGKRLDFDNSDTEDMNDEDGSEQDYSGNNSDVTKSAVFFQKSGVNWSNESPQPLVNIITNLRSNSGSQSTHFARAVCQRSSCRCLLRGHDTLMLFPVFDAILCEATWEKILDTHLVAKSSSHFLARLHSHTSTSTSETQANILMFRQCRGWYEVMNENHECVPHWTTLDEVKRARPSTFLVRQELRCLLAPQHLWLPPAVLPSFQGGQLDKDASPPLPVSSAIISEAIGVSALSASSLFILKPGSLLSYVDFLPSCVIKRGKKTKTIPLILAVEKPRQQKTSQVIASPRKLYYLGIEESTSQAIFPAKFDLSPIAGPQNISGVHMLSSVLRKFRLPLSVSPVAVPEKRISGNASSLSSDSEMLDYATAQSTKPVNIFPTVPGIYFTEKNFIRLQKIRRGDILIVAPIDAPDRFFLITPTLLQDHLFQLGSTEDPIYHRLASGHRNRSTNFLSTAHPRDSLSYLLPYLKNITNESRSPIKSTLPSIVPSPLHSLQPHEISSELAKSLFQETGKDPRVGPECNMTPDQVDQIYEELDDLYFFTRNGYFPPRNRQRRGPNKKTEPDQPLEALPNNQILSQNQTNISSAHGYGVRQLQNAEQLLAASLNLSVYK